VFTALCASQPNPSNVFLQRAAPILQHLSTHQNTLINILATNQLNISRQSTLQQINEWQLVLHLGALLTTSPRNFLSALMFNPSSFQNSFLPTMPADSIASIVRAGNTYNICLSRQLTCLSVRDNTALWRHICGYIYSGEFIYFVLE
jgi:hypothetical protein